MVVLNPIHTRDTPLAEWPFESTDDVDEFIIRVVEVVRDAMGAEPEVSVSATYPDRAFPMMKHDEFRSARAELPFEGLSTLVIKVQDPKDPDFAVNLLLSDPPRSASLAVRGTSVTRVDGVDVQVRKALDNAFAKVEASREAEAQRHREERAGYVEQLTPPGPYGLPIGAAVGTLVRAGKRKPKRPASGAAPPRKASRWRRFISHPWAVEIVGGTIASAAAVGVVATIILVFR
jgi:hypothetical protein